MIARVVHVRSAEWRNAPASKRAYIGRACYGFARSLWANPFKITASRTREQAVAEYEPYMRDRLAHDPQLVISLRNLEGSLLGCWCKSLDEDGPDIPCHGDVLIKLLEEYR